MLKTINALKARRNLGQLLEEVFYNKDQFVIERAGKAMAVVISPSEYETFKRQREQDMGIFDEIRRKNKEASVEELEDDIQVHWRIKCVFRWACQLFLPSMCPSPDHISQLSEAPVDFHLLLPQWHISSHSPRRWKAPLSE